MPPFILTIVVVSYIPPVPGFRESRSYVLLKSIVRPPFVDANSFKVVIEGLAHMKFFPRLFIVSKGPKCFYIRDLLFTGYFGNEIDGFFITFG